MSRKLCALVAGIMLYASCLQAEIVLVTVKWTVNLCQDYCVRNLYKELGKVKGVGEVVINQAGAQADLRWKPNVPFSFVDVDAAMRMVGPSIEDIRMKVHGTLTHTQDSVTLISTGDNTHFQLLSPIIPSKTQYVEEYNVATHTLWAATREQLLQAEANHLSVTIDGQLFRPEWAPPLYILIQKITVDQPKKEGKQ